MIDKSLLYLRNTIYINCSDEPNHFMKTKILYVLTSTPADIYMEQLWVSVTSLKLYNPNAKVTLLMDHATRDNLTDYRAKLLDLIDEPIVVETSADYSQKEISRYIKTTARQWVKGDFLFIDTDTVIAGDLSEIDYLEGDLLLCPEFHDSFQNDPMKGSLVNKVMDIFSVDISNAPYYYNSGVILCRDTEFTHAFYKKWNENWTYSSQAKNVSFDQPSLAKTNFDFNNAIKLLDGQYHCQVFISIKYLHRAKIIHFYNMTWFKESTISPFSSKELYQDIKNSGSINNGIMALIKDVKNQFSPVSVVVGGKELSLLVDYGNSLIPILIDSNTRSKKICKFIIRKVIRLYWILQKINGRNH